MILLLFFVFSFSIFFMTSSDRKFGDENPFGDRSSRAPTTQRMIEEISRDEPDGVSSRQGQSDPNESDE